MKHILERKLHQNNSQSHVFLRSLKIAPYSFRLCRSGEKPAIFKIRKKRGFEICFNIPFPLDFTRNLYRSFIHWQLAGPDLKASSTRISSAIQPLASLLDEGLCWSNFQQSIRDSMYVVHYASYAYVQTIILRSFNIFPRDVCKYGHLCKLSE